MNYIDMWFDSKLYFQEFEVKDAISNLKWWPAESEVRTIMHSDFHLTLVF